MTSVHLSSEDFLRTLEDRAAIRSLALALGVPDLPSAVLQAVKNLLDARNRPPGGPYSY